MAKMQRDKGLRFERSIVNCFKAAGVDAKRVPLSGASEGFKGDVLVEGRGRTWQFELKARRDDFKRLYGWLEGNDGVIIKADRQEALVVIPLSRFIEMEGE